MAYCLGINIDNNLIKYALVFSENSEIIRVEKYGIKFIENDLKQTLDSIILENSFQDIPICINSNDSIYKNIQIYGQVKEKSYIQSIMKLEFESWCEKNAKSPDNYIYSYMISEVKSHENKRNAFLNIILKESVNKWLTLSDKIICTCPSKPLVNEMVNEKEKNYILVNLDNALSLSVVLDEKIVEFCNYDIGMEQLLNEFTNNLGSYHKAYNACKKINVYTDEGENYNDYSLEQILEPLLQDILKECSPKVNQYRDKISKIILTGMGTSFINIDLLFSQFFDLKCEILIPSFVKDTLDTKYIYETNEVIDAISLADECLNPKHNDLHYLNKKNKIKSKVNSLFHLSQNKKSKEKTTTVIDDKTLNSLNHITIVVVVIVISYMLFSCIYTASVNRTINNMNEKSQKISSETQNVNSDISYINKNMNEYKEINEQVEDIKNKIENNQIGKFSTYNVASLLQNIIKIMPTNVQLVNISSNDNKYVTITASSDNYEDLGYFFSQIKLENVLNNAKIIKVNNAEITTVEIGGDLP